MKIGGLIDEEDELQDWIITVEISVKGLNLSHAMEQARALLPEGAEIVSAETE